MNLVEAINLVSTSLNIEIIEIFVQKTPAASIGTGAKTLAQATCKQGAI